MKGLHHNRARFAVLWGGTVASLGVAGSLSLPALAQIVPDDTLGAEGSRVSPNVLIRGALGDRIDGGALRGSNLFHSFSQFNVNDGQRVYFSNPAGIENILSRVTGGDVSDIMGTLGVDGGANLYLLNPNGIIFGPNAQLDIAGSFVSSTGSAFIFPNGEVFSAVDPQAPPLLTINVPVGIQYGANPKGLIRNEGILSVRGDLTLDAGRLELQGQLRAEGDLTLQAQDTLIIRDSVTAPFIASSGQNLLVQGNQAVDIFALNHPNSGLFAGNDLTLRSATPVIGDVHYWSGGNFRIEQVDESLGVLTSPNDPVIRATGDVSFASYTGASLHIFAGGSVTVPGAITITGADPVNGIVETVTLSDGSTVAIDGQTTPTLDIRAGTLAVNPVGAIGDTTGFVPGVPATGAGATSADITIGSILNPEGTVFLTNQYQPNLALAGGDIRVGAIDTSAVVYATLTQFRVQGGDVVIDARGGIAAESVNTSANATVNITSVNAIGDVEVEARGGAIRLTSQDGITTGSLTSSAQLEVDLSADANEVVDADGNRLLTGGTIGNVTLTTTGGAIALESGTSITTAALDSSAKANTSMDADTDTHTDTNAVTQVFTSTRDITGGMIGDVTLNTTGGTIALESGNSITTTTINSSANANASLDAGMDVYLFTDALVVNATGGEIGNVTLHTTGGQVALSSGTSIATDAMNSSVSAFSSTNTGVLVTPSWEGSEGNAIGGRIGDVMLNTIRGAIVLEGGTSIATDAIDSSAEAGVSADAGAWSWVGDATAGTIGNITLNTTGRAIALSSGNFIETAAIDSSASANAGLRVLADGTVRGGANGVAEALGGTVGDVSLTTTGGSIALESGTSITTATINSFGFADVGADLFASAFPDVNAGEIAVGGSVGDFRLITTGGAVNLDSTDSITTDSLASLARSSIDVNVSGLSGYGTDGTTGDQSIIAIGGALNLTSELGGVALRKSSSIRSNVLSGDGDGGDVRIVGASLQLTNNLLTTTVAGIGDAGDITLDIADNAVILGSRLLTGLESGADSAGAGGSIAITAGSIELSNFSFLNTSTFGTGDAGDVQLTTRQGDISLADSSIFSLTALNGDAGDISIQSAGALRLVGNSVISTTVALGAEGSGGDILIAAPGGVFIDGSRDSTASVDGATHLGESFLNEVEPNDLFVLDPNTFDFLPFDPSNAQAIDTAFGRADVGNPNPNVLFSTDVPYVAIAGRSGDGGPFDSGSYDAYSFEVFAVGTQVTFDVDEAKGDYLPLDPILRLYNEQGTDLASNDNALVTLGGEGSIRQTDPYLTFIFNEPGTYFIRVGEWNDLFNRDNSLLTLGTYTLNVSRVDDFLVSSGITTQTRSNGRSGDITINAPTINIQNGGQISAETLRNGQAGNITLQPFGNGQDLTLTIEGEGSQISSSTQSSGAGSNLILRAPNSITLQGSGQLLAETSSSGSAGDVRIETADLTLRNGIEVSTTTESTGTGGSIFVSGIDNTHADRVALINAELSAETTGTAPAGNIRIRTGEFVMSNRARVTTTTTNSGDGGDIIIRADDFIRLSNSTILAESNPIDENGTVLTTTPGNAGQVRITTPQLFLRNRAQISASNVSSSSEGISLQGLDRLQLGDRSTITASTESGRAGNLTIFMADGGDIRLTGGSRIAAAATGQRTNRVTPVAGDLTIRGDRLTVQDDSEITVSAQHGRAGSLEISAREISLDNGRIEAEAGFSRENGQGAIIRLEDLDLLIMRHDSLISANALGRANGGNITINTPATRGGFIIGLPLSNSDIIATASNGRGGEINVYVDRVFGFEVQDQANLEVLTSNSTNDISASSASGPQGVVNIQTLNVDPSQGLAELPITPVDAANQIAPGCGLGNNFDDNEFIVTGRGGLPPSSGDPLTASAVDVPWVVADDIAPNNVAPNNVAPDNAIELSATATDAPLVEAQGMWVDDDGNIHLVAEVETELTANPTAIASQFCAVSSH